MGTSTNGIISFGVVCEEGTEFPWEDLEEWWRDENGFKNIHEPYTEEGEYAEGWSIDDPRFEEYFQHRRQWLKENPVPVALENYCSNNCPMYAIVVPNLGYMCHRGYPEKFDPEKLIVKWEDQYNLIKFLDKYGIEYESDPSWILTSYWG